MSLGGLGDCRSQEWGYGLVGQSLELGGQSLELGASSDPPPHPTEKYLCLCCSDVFAGLEHLSN